MKTIHHGANARDSLLHIETDGAVVNILVGLSDADGRRVTSVEIIPDDESRGGDASGHVWQLDGARNNRVIRQAPPRVTIRTRYACHPGSNVGSIRATALGRRATVRIDPALSREDMRRRAAEVLAARIGAVVAGAPVATDDPLVWNVPATFGGQS